MFIFVKQSSAWHIVSAILMSDTILVSVFPSVTWEHNIELTVRVQRMYVNC